MGLLILPFLLLAFVISIAATILWISNVVKNKIRPLEFVLGIGLTFILYSIIVLSYKIAGGGWAFGPMFIIPIVMFLIPFALYLGLSNSKDLAVLNFRNTPLISITFTAILAIAFYDSFFDFFQYFGIEKNY